MQDGKPGGVAVGFDRERSVERIVVDLPVLRLVLCHLAGRWRGGVHGHPGRGRPVPSVHGARAPAVDLLLVRRGSSRRPPRCEASGRLLVRRPHHSRAERLRCIHTGGRVRA
eukprot:2587350-Prymnesium_polylepis.1